MYNTLGWRKSDYEKIIHNSSDLTDELKDMFDDLPIIRDSKIEEILKKEINIDSVYSDEDKNWSNIVLKFPKDKKSACDGLENLVFIGYSKIDSNPIYKINLPRGFEVVDTLDRVLNN